MSDETDALRRVGVQDRYPQLLLDLAADVHVACERAKVSGIPWDRDDERASYGFACAVQAHLPERDPLECLHALLAVPDLLDLQNGDSILDAVRSVIELLASTLTDAFMSGDDFDWPLR